MTFFKYLNLSMRSNVKEYAITDDAIYVVFKNNNLCYVYIKDSVGEANLETMKRLAKSVAV